ncbi:MAG: hypothetical protein R2729_29440 [Bryobacteraceae bacterium]
MARFLVPIGVFLAGSTVTSLFFINFCATVYQCGCQSLWTTADQFCNIHASHGRHCPWCSFGYTGYVLVYGTMVAAQAVTVFAAVRRGWTWPLQLAATLLAFPAIGLILAVALGLYTGYWN